MDFYKVKDSYVLATKLTNKDSNTMIIHKHALPSVMEWPEIQYFKVKGLYLSQPNEWIKALEQDIVENPYDFSTLSPIKKFK